MTELALLNYKEYCGTQSNLVKRAFATKLIQHLIYEGHRFLTKRGNGWITMSDEQIHIKFSRMMGNQNYEKRGRVKVKPGGGGGDAGPAVKLNKKNWNDDDCKTLREYITENDVDNMFLWDHIAKKLNRSERACKEKMRMIFDCGIYSEEKEGEIIVFLNCFNFKINRLICGVIFALALLSNLTDIKPSSKVIPSAFRLDALFRQHEVIKDFENSQKRGFTGVHFSPVPPIKLSYFDRGEYMRLYADNFHELRQDQRMVLEELNGQQCIMPDLIVRDIHNFDPESGGAPISHC